MTNKEIITQIKVEIERRISAIKDYNIREYEGEVCGLKRLLSFIDTLRVEEPALEEVSISTNTRADMSEKLGCGIEIPYFGANYPDAVCIDGYLWDLDSGDERGLTIGGDEPCPVCNTKAWLERVMENEEFETESNALAYVERLKKKYKR